MQKQKQQKQQEQQPIKRETQAIDYSKYEKKIQAILKQHIGLYDVYGNPLDAYRNIPTFGGVMVGSAITYPGSLNNYEQVRTSGDGYCYYRSLGYAVISELMNRLRQYTGVERDRRVKETMRVCVDHFGNPIVIKYGLADHLLELTSDNTKVSEKTGDEWFKIHRPNQSTNTTYKDELNGHPLKTEIARHKRNITKEQVTPEEIVDVLKGNSNIPKTEIVQYADTPIVDSIAISYLKKVLNPIGITHVFINIYEYNREEGDVYSIVLPFAEGVNRSTDTQDVKKIQCPDSKPSDCIEIKLLKNIGHYNALVRSSDVTQFKTIQEDDFTLRKEEDLIKKHASLLSR